MDGNFFAPTPKTFSVISTGTGTPRCLVQAVNDLPKFNRRAAAKSCVETNAAMVALCWEETACQKGVTRSRLATMAGCATPTTTFFFLNAIVCEADLVTPCRTTTQTNSLRYCE